MKRKFHNSGPKSKLGTSCEAVSLGHHLMHFNECASKHPQPGGSKRKRSLRILVLFAEQTLSQNQLCLSDWDGGEATIAAHLIRSLQFCVVQGGCASSQLIDELSECQKGNEAWTPRLWPESSAHAFDTGRCCAWNQGMHRLGSFHDEVTSQCCSQHPA